MGQGTLGVGDLVDVEEQCAWNMLGEIFDMSVTTFARHVPGGIENDEVGCVKLAGELFGLNQRCLGLRQIHLSQTNTLGTAASPWSSQCGTGSPFSRKNVGLNSLL